MRKIPIKVFLIAFAVALAYYAAWFFLRNQLHIYDTSLNLPGGIILFGGMPWQLFFSPKIITSGPVVVAIVSSFLFATNMAIISQVFMYLRVRYRAIKST